MFNTESVCIGVTFASSLGDKKHQFNISGLPCLKVHRQIGRTCLSVVGHLSSPCWISTLQGYGEIHVSVPIVGYCMIEVDNVTSVCINWCCECTRSNCPIRAIEVRLERTQLSNCNVDNLDVVQRCIRWRGNDAGYLVNES